MKTLKKIFRFFSRMIKWTLIIVIILAIVSALYNLTLPTKSKIVDHLSSDEKAYISETIHLQQNMGNKVWPGWGDMQIPVIVYNEKYAFLIGYPNPPSGWLKMPDEEFRGKEWEVVKNDDFLGATYYRQLLPNPDINPENFTVKVGDRWALTMQTREYAAIDFYRGFKNDLPPVLNAVFPYCIFWNILMGRAENYIGGMAHEAFHAYQGMVVPQRLANGENVSGLEDKYPFETPQNENGWIEETDFLLQAYNAQSDQVAREQVARYIQKRQERRKQANLSAEMISYEQNREWLEGLAKYAELTIGISAQKDQSYKPVNEIVKVSDFKSYKNRMTYYDLQIEEVKRTVHRSGETRFYYVGMLQAVMLDRLMPDWKKEGFKDGVFLDELLEKAIKEI